MNEKIWSTCQNTNVIYVTTVEKANGAAETPTWKMWTDVKGQSDHCKRGRRDLVTKMGEQLNVLQKRRTFRKKSTIWIITSKRELFFNHKIGKIFFILKVIFRPCWQKGPIFSYRCDLFGKKSWKLDFHIFLLIWLIK